MASSDRLRAVLEEAGKQGFHVCKTGKSHYKITSPANKITYTGSTPSDSRSVTNFISALRHLGFQWPAPCRKTSRLSTHVAPLHVGEIAVSRDDRCIKLIEYAHSQGWRSENDGQRYKLYTPEGIDKSIVFIDARGGRSSNYENSLHRLMRLGLIWPPIIHKNPIQKSIDNVLELEGGKYSVALSLSKNIDFQEYIPGIDNTAVDSATLSHLHGAAAKLHKLTDVQVREIRDLFASDKRKENFDVIASMYDVTSGYIKRIVVGAERVKAGGPMFPDLLSTYIAPEKTLAAITSTVNAVTTPSLPPVSDYSNAIVPRFAARLVLLRETKRWNQAQLAQHAGISANYIQRIEQGEAPSRKALEGLQRAFQCTPLFFSDDMDPAQRWNVFRTIISANDAGLKNRLADCIFEKEDSKVVYVRSSTPPSTKFLPNTEVLCIAGIRVYGQPIMIDITGLANVLQPEVEAKKEEPVQVIATSPVPQRTQQQTQSVAQQQTPTPTAPTAANNDDMVLRLAAPMVAIAEKYNLGFGEVMSMQRLSAHIHPRTETGWENLLLAIRDAKGA